MTISPSPCFVKAIFLALFVILIPSGDARRRIHKPCPVVLPDGQASLRNISEGQERIINGELATNLIPYMGALKSFGELVCSATLLSEYWALTAAHCLFSPDITTFVTGGDTIYDGVEIEIEAGIIHELYPIGSQVNIINDIQLVKLKTPAPPTAKYVKLNTESHFPAPHSFVRTAGYGETLGTAFPTSGVLRQVDVPVQPMDVCREQYSGINIFETYHVCAGYERGGCDSCSGDSGGPLFAFDEDLNVVQVGIVSFGYQCALPDSSGVYARVSSQIDWLLQQGAVFQTSSSGVDVFEYLDTGATLSNAEDAVSDNVSNGNDEETMTVQAETEAEASSTPLASEPTPESTYEGDSGSSSPNSGSLSSGPSTSGPSTSGPSPSEAAPSGASSLGDSSSGDSSSGASSSGASSSGASSSSGECFPGNASVTLEDGTTKAMRNLKIGDSIQVGPNQFSEVFMFTHRIAHGEYEFVKITNSVSSDALLLTRGHMLPINGVYKQAGMARAGDVLELGDGQKAEILTAENFVSTGLYNPHTIDGHVVVNGVVASTFTTAVDIGTAHALLAPLRYVFQAFGRDFSGGLLNNGFALLSK